MGRYTVVMTGASGSVYGLRMVEQLLAAGHEVVFIATDAGREVCAYELGFRMPDTDRDVAARELASFLDIDAGGRLRVAFAADMFDAIASGSHRIDAMVVAPASMGFCGSVAHALALDLPERAADVCLKERIPLVLVPRETPMSLIHLRNLTALAEAGAVIVPAMPGFYQKPKTIDDLTAFVIGKILDVLGVEHALFERWGEQGGQS